MPKIEDDLESYMGSTAGEIHPVVKELSDWVYASTDRLQNFMSATNVATSQDIYQMRMINSLADFFLFASSLLYWVPTESADGVTMFDHASVINFVLCQPSILQYQTPIHPLESKTQTAPDQTFVSRWLIRFYQCRGTFLDTPASLTSETLSSFISAPAYHMSNYLVPREGWRTFNHFFARRTKPGVRPISHIGDNSVLVSPADSTFCGHLPVSSDSTITVKGLTWSPDELLADSPFSKKGAFANGLWSHSFLGAGDYHRVHTPVAGKVLDAKVVSGLTHLEIVAVDAPSDPSSDTGRQEADPVQHASAGRKVLQKRRVFKATNIPGYQFLQRRGLVILEADFGLVAVVLVGMAAISSVMLTAEVGVTLHKGEEIGYFQAGGSDVIVIWGGATQRITLTAEVGKHYNMGEKIGILC